MAQMGCYVPAEMAVIPVRTSLLSRIGTGDDLENNVSTFLMEMREIAQVRFCRPPSLLVALAARLACTWTATTREVGG